MADEKKRENEKRKREESPREYHTCDETVKKHYLLSLMPVIGPPPPGPTGKLRARSRSPRAKSMSPRRDDSLKEVQQLKEAVSSLSPRRAKPEVLPKIVQPASMQLVARPVHRKPFPTQGDKKSPLSATPVKPKRKEAPKHPFVAPPPAPHKVGQAKGSQGSVPSARKEAGVADKQKPTVKVTPQPVKQAPGPSAGVRKAPPIEERRRTVPEMAKPKPQFTQRRVGTVSPALPTAQTPAAAAVPRDTFTESQAMLATVAGTEVTPRKTVLFGAPVEDPLFESLNAERKQGPPAPKPEMKYEHPKVPLGKPDMAERLRKLQAPEEESTAPSQASFVPPKPSPRPEFPEEKLHTASAPPTQGFGTYQPHPFHPREEPAQEKPEEAPCRPIPTIVIEPPPVEEAPAPPPKQPEPQKPKPTLKKGRSEPDLTKAPASQVKTKPPVEVPKLREGLPQIGDYGIPDQQKLLDVLLDGDPKIDDFGGFLRAYFSPSLRTFALLNLQGRYRGAENTDCLKAIDIEKMASKEDAEAAARARNLEKRELELESLRAAAVDEEHFEFLKGFANMQAVTFPITVSQGLLQETVPMLDEKFHFYIDHLGQDHKCTIEAGEHFVRHRNRLNMYENL